MDKPVMYVKEITWLGPMCDHGWGNGYVAVPPGHPWYGKDYDDIDCSVHCGLTFSAFKEAMKPCTEIENIPNNWYIVGFDTAHSQDDISVWPKEAVIAETQQLLDQAIQAQGE